MVMVRYGATDAQVKPQADSFICFGCTNFKRKYVSLFYLEEAFKVHPKVTPYH